MGRYTDIELNKIKNLVHDVMKKSKIPGLSLTILNKEKITYMTYGYGNVQKKEPITPESCFEIGSLSKSFTALAVFY